MLNTCTRIAQIAMQLNPVELVTPTNAASEKKGFLKAYNAGFAVNPVFKYNKRVLRQASKLRKELESLKAEFEGLADKYPATCTDDPEKELAVKNIIRDRILDAIITCEMAKAILEGNDATLASLSAEKYGSPTCTMVGNAYEAAQDAGKKYGGVLDRETMKALKGMRFEAQEIMHYFERALELYGIKDWIVVMDDQATAIDVRDKNISGRPLVVIPSARKVDGAKLLELIGHEIECHLRSSENARCFWAETLTEEYQPLVPLLAKSDNEFVYEGYAKQNDVRVTGSDALPTPNYLIAMHQAFRGEAFVTAFEVVAGFEVQKGVSEKTAQSRAWTAAYRVFRGCSSTANDGTTPFAFQKDFAYFAGYRTVSENDHLDFSSMAMRDIAKLTEAGFELKPHYYHQWLCLDPWKLGIL